LETNIGFCGGEEDVDGCCFRKITLESKAGKDYKRIRQVTLGRRLNYLEHFGDY
jgi:hypothetical protein